MTIEDIQRICMSMKAVTQDIKWENHLCFNIGDKMFIITSPDEVPPMASLKVSDEVFDALTLRDGIIPAPYLARYKWVHVDDLDRLSEKEWEQYLKEAYMLVARKLPQKKQKELGIAG